MKFSWKETLAAFYELYEMDLKGKLDDVPEGSRPSSNPITIGYILRMKEIEKLFADSGVNIKVVDPIARNIIRVCVSSIILGEDVPLAISRAIRISERFSSTNSYKFLHATVSKIIKNYLKVEKSRKT